MLLGVDVSTYQRVINWAHLVDAGIVFAYARVADGTTVDDMYRQHTLAARAVEIPIGGYQFGHPSMDVQACADLLLATASLYELRPCVDMETLSKGVVPSNAASWADAWCEIVKRALARLYPASDAAMRGPLIYASTSYYNTMVTQLSTVQGWDWWCAEYDTGKPSQPRTKWPYVAHQYAGDVPMDGQVGLWDRDAVYGETIAILRT